MTYARKPQVKRFHPLGDPPIVLREEVEYIGPDYDDIFVISLVIVNALVKRILIDIRSFANVLLDA